LKLSITQIFLSILVIFAACYVIGWVVFIIPTLIPEYEVLFNVARYSSLLLLPLGVVVLITATIQWIKFREKNIKLPIIQIVCGMLISAISVFWAIEHNTILIFGFDIINNAYYRALNKLLGNLDSIQLTVKQVNGVLILLGLAVLIIAIIQLQKIRRAPI